MFALHERLAADTLPVGRLRLCRVLLMNDATYPWLILVPEVADLREIFELEAADRALLMEEIALVSRALADAFRPDKINVAALGNLVPQLHVHVVARFRGDPAWPAPIWGRDTPHAYAPGEAEEFGRRIAAALGEALRPTA